MPIEEAYSGQEASETNNVLVSVSESELSYPALVPFSLLKFGVEVPNDKYVDTSLWVTSSTLP